MHPTYDPRTAMMPSLLIGHGGFVDGCFPLPSVPEQPSLFGYKSLGWCYVPDNLSEQDSRHGLVDSDHPQASDHQEAMVGTWGLGSRSRLGSAFGLVIRPGKS